MIYKPNKFNFADSTIQKNPVLRIFLKSIYISHYM